MNQPPYQGPPQGHGHHGHHSANGPPHAGPYGQQGYGPPYSAYGQPPRKSGGGAKVLLFVLAGIVCLVFGSCAIVCVTLKAGEVHEANKPEEKAKRQETAAATRALLLSTTDSLDRIYDTFPKTLVEAPCDDAKIPEQAIAVVTYGGLESFRKGTNTFAVGDSELRLTKTFLNHRERPPANPSADDVERLTVGFVVPMKDLMQTPVIGVIRSVSVALPSVVPLTGNFLPGSYDGWLVLFDRTTATPLCQAKFHATSSASVDKAVLQGGNDAVRGDLAKHVDEAKEAARARLSPKLKLAW